MLYLIIALCLTMLIIAGLHRNASHKKSRSKHKHHSRFHCVETFTHKDSCNAAKKIHGKRFLSAEAPTLPLPACKKAHCHCEYKHHEDRRSESRRQDVGMQHDMYGLNGETERRHKGRHGRRATDH